MVELPDVVDLLIRAEPIPERFRDHALGGNWKSYRDLHLKPDLVLIYRLEGADELLLARLGSHSELGIA